MPRSDRPRATIHESEFAVRRSLKTRPVQRFHASVATPATTSGPTRIATLRLPTGRGSVGRRTSATTATSMIAAGRSSKQTASGMETRANDAEPADEWNRATASTSASTTSAISIPLVPTTPSRNHADGVSATSSQAAAAEAVAPRQRVAEDDGAQQHRRHPVRQHPVATGQRAGDDADDQRSTTVGRHRRRLPRWRRRPSGWRPRRPR